MKKSIETDLADLTAILENFVSSLGSLSQVEKIDVAARLKPVAKACKQLDDEVKELVKVKLKHKEGTVVGVLFKAVLKLVDTKRLDQKALKEAEPELVEEYMKDATDERVTFELR